MPRLSGNLRVCGGRSRWAAEPAIYDLAAPYTNVTVHIDIDGFAGTVTLEYVGAPETIAAAGVCAPELLRRGKAGRARCDGDGDRAFIERRKTWVRLRLCRKSIENALKLPGVTLARIRDEQEAFRRAYASTDASPWMRDHAAAFVKPAAVARGALRLVVDNTRPREAV